MSIEPPPYHEALANLEKALTPEKREILTATVVEHYTKPESTSQLLSEVHALADSASKVDQLFFNVQVDLGKLTYTDVNLKDIWDGYYKEFLALLKTSGTTASEAVNYLDEYVEIVVPVINAVEGPKDVDGRKEAIATLKKFLTKVHDGKKEIDLKELEKLADQHSDAFQQLREKIGSFVGQFAKYAADRSVELNKEIQDVKDNLEKLRKELQEISSEVTKLALAVGATAFATGVGAWLGFAFLGPFGLIGALVIGISAIAVEIGFLVDALKRQSTKSKEIEVEQLKLNKLLDEQKTLELLKARLESQQGEILTICQKIDQFRHVWIAVATDAGRLQKALESFSEADPEGFNTFKAHVARTQKLYIPLRDGLLAYINHSAIPKPAE